MDDQLPFVQGHWKQKAGPPYPTWQRHRGEQVALLTISIPRCPQRTEGKLLCSGWTITGISSTKEHINTRGFIWMTVFKFIIF